MRQIVFVLLLCRKNLFSETCKLIKCQVCYSAEQSIKDTNLVPTQFQDQWDMKKEKHQQVDDCVYTSCGANNAITKKEGFRLLHDANVNEFIWTYCVSLVVFRVWYFFKLIYDSKQREDDNILWQYFQNYFDWKLANWFDFQ